VAPASHEPEGPIGDRRSLYAGEVPRPELVVSVHMDTNGFASAPLQERRLWACSAGAMCPSDVLPRACVALHPGGGVSAPDGSRPVVAMSASRLRSCPETTLAKGLHAYWASLLVGPFPVPTERHTPSRGTSRGAPSGARHPFARRAERSSITTQRGHSEDPLEHPVVHRCGVRKGCERRAASDAARSAPPLTCTFAPI
jgi:hypothetical protein